MARHRQQIAFEIENEKKNWADNTKANRRGWRSERERKENTRKLPLEKLKPPATATDRKRGKQQQRTVSMHDYYYFDAKKAFSFQFRSFFLFSCRFSTNLPKWSEMRRDELALMPPNRTKMKMMEMKKWKTKNMRENSRECFIRNWKMIMSRWWVHVRVGCKPASECQVFLNKKNS